MSNVTRLDNLPQKGRERALLKERLVTVFSLDEDEQTFSDTLEGLDDLPDMCALTLREAKTREALAEGLSGLIGALKARRERLLDSVDRARAAVADAMANANERRLIAPDMTISLREGKPRLIIDVDRLPEAFRVAQTTIKPDRPAIQAAVDRGDVPEGVEIANGHPFVVISQR